jgi:Na+/H+ antiporter NhaD/arsenite permease-like protein
MHVDSPELDRVLAVKAIAALAGFAALAACGVSLGGASMLAAAALMLVARTPSRNTLELVDWSLLGFFAGIFVVIAGVAHAGVLDRIFDVVAPVVTRGGYLGDLAFVVLVVVLSNVVSNVPLVLVALPWIGRLSDPASGYVLLAVASTLAGTLTLFGSVANMIVMERAGPHGETHFLRFLRFGVVLTATDLVLALGILAVERVTGIASWLGLAP